MKTTVCGKSIIVSLTAIVCVGVTLTVQAQAPVLNAVQRAEAGLNQANAEKAVADRVAGEEKAVHERTAAVQAAADQAVAAAKASADKAAEVAKNAQGDAAKPAAEFAAKAAEAFKAAEQAAAAAKAAVEKAAAERAAAEKSQGEKTAAAATAARRVLAEKSFAANMALRQARTEKAQADQALGQKVAAANQKNAEKAAADQAAANAVNEKTAADSAIAANASSDQIRQVAAGYKPTIEYPNTGLGRNLRSIAGLIAGGLTTRIYFTFHGGGFDTHVNQRPHHDGLMRELNDAIVTFYKDLTNLGQAKRVLTFTTSEFGRTARENGGKGTDHGAAAGMFMFGPGVKPGVHGAHPSLKDVFGGGGDWLKMTTDYRSVYATVLEKWIGVPSEPVLGAKYPLIDCIA